MNNGPKKKHNLSIPISDVYLSVCVCTYTRACVCAMINVYACMCTRVLVDVVKPHLLIS